MSRFQAVPYDEQSEINLSPMLDVVFIMLIFFIVVASFVKEDGLPVTLPAGLEIQPDDLASINIVVRPMSIFIVNGRSMTAGSVPAYVRALHAENPGASFGVILASGSKVKDAVVAIEAGRKIGFSRVPISREES
jgi:biopolymer transport protein ExbD